MNIPSRTSLLQTPVESSGSNGMIQLANDLAELRPNRALRPTSLWIHYLIEFYRHPITMKFEAIDGNLLGHQVLLLSKVDKISDEQIRLLIGELSYLSREHFDHHAGSKLYVALNRLLRKRVLHLQAKPKKQSKPRI